MPVLALPGRMLLIWVQPPSENESRSVLVGFFLPAHGRLDQLGQVAVRLIPAFVGRLRMLRVGLDAGQWHAAFALRCLARARSQLLACHLWIDFRHCRTPSVS